MSAVYYHTMIVRSYDYSNSMIVVKVYIHITRRLIIQSKMSYIEILEAAVARAEARYEKAYADENIDLATKIHTEIMNLQQSREREREFIRERENSASKVMVCIQIFLLFLHNSL